jgi:hypothetical protein
MDFIISPFPVIDEFSIEVIPVLILGGLAGSLRILSDYFCLCIFEPLVLIFISTFLALLAAFHIRALAIMLMRRVHLMMGLFATPLLLMRGHALLDHE